MDTAATFEEIAGESFHRPLGNSVLIRDRRYRGLFGVTSSVTAILWTKARNKFPPNTQKCHLLWTLLFLKCYPTNTVLCSLCGVDEATVHYWVWVITERISNLNLVCRNSTHHVRVCFYLSIGTMECAGRRSIVLSMHGIR